MLRFKRSLLPDSAVCYSYVRNTIAVVDKFRVRVVWFENDVFAANVRFLSFYSILLAVAVTPAEMLQPPILVFARASSRLSRDASTRTAWRSPFVSPCVCVISKRAAFIGCIRICRCRKWTRSTALFIHPKSASKFGALGLAMCRRASTRFILEAATKPERRNRLHQDSAFLSDPEAQVWKTVSGVICHFRQLQGPSYTSLLKYKHCWVASRFAEFEELDCQIFEKNWNFFRSNLKKIRNRIRTQKFWNRSRVGVWKCDSGHLWFTRLESRDLCCRSQKLLRVTTDWSASVTGTSDFGNQTPSEVRSEGLFAFGATHQQDALIIRHSVAILLVLRFSPQDLAYFFGHFSAIDQKNFL